MRRRTEFYDDQETCEEYYDGYACKTQNGCYVKGAPKQCPSGEYVTCPGKEGNIATPTPTDNKSGDEYCNTCAYACDTEHQYYTEKPNVPKSTRPIIANTAVPPDAIRRPAATTAAAITALLPPAPAHSKATSALKNLAATPKALPKPAPAANTPPDSVPTASAMTWKKRKAAISPARKMFRLRIHLYLCQRLLQRCRNLRKCQYRTFLRPGPQLAVFYGIGLPYRHGILLRAGGL